MDCFSDPTCLTGGGTGGTGGTGGSNTAFVSCIVTNSAGNPEVDCANASCALHPACYESDCTDEIDQDNDGDIDCGGLDSDCVGTAVCDGESGINADGIPMCVDGIDNNYDGLIDCEDVTCQGTAECGESDCEDGVDNDGDFLTDLEDSECFSSLLVDDFDGAFEGDFEGSLVLNILSAQGTTQWCIGSLTATSTLDGYQRASVVGTGSCTTSSNTTLNFDLNGALFRSSATSGSLVGQLGQSVSQLGVDYTVFADLDSGSLFYDGTATTLTLSWSTVLPNATGTLLPLSGQAILSQ